MKPSTIPPLQAWFAAATEQERQVLADEVGTTVAMLRQYAGGYRRASASVAQRVERGVAASRKTNRKLPAVYRTDLADACAGCEFALKCLGKRAVASDFGVVRS